MSYAKKLFPSKMPAKIFCFNGFLQKCHFQCAIDDNVKVIHVLSSKSSGLQNKHHPFPPQGSSGGRGLMVFYIP
jgi:hypothetical protein